MSISYIFAEAALRFGSLDDEQPLPPNICPYSRLLGKQITTRFVGTLSYFAGPIQDPQKHQPEDGPHKHAHSCIMITSDLRLCMFAWCSILAERDDAYLRQASVRPQSRDQITNCKSVVVNSHDHFGSDIPESFDAAMLHVLNSTEYESPNRTPKALLHLEHLRIPRGDAAQSSCKRATDVRQCSSSSHRVAGRTRRYNCHTSKVTFHFGQCSVIFGLDNYACFPGVFSTCFPSSISWASTRLDMPTSAIPKIDLVPFTNCFRLGTRRKAWSGSISSSFLCQPLFVATTSNGSCRICMLVFST